jgi:hypothetical protein
MLYTHHVHIHIPRVHLELYSIKEFLCKSLKHGRRTNNVRVLLEAEKIMPIDEESTDEGQIYEFKKKKQRTDFIEGWNAAKILFSIAEEEQRTDFIEGWNAAKILFSIKPAPAAAAGAAALGAPAVGPQGAAPVAGAPPKAKETGYFKSRWPQGAAPVASAASPKAKETGYFASRYGW